jgi:hypothetical protein
MTVDASNLGMHPPAFGRGVMPTLDFTCYRGRKTTPGVEGSLHECNDLQ